MLRKLMNGKKSLIKNNSDWEFLIYILGTFFWICSVIFANKRQLDIVKVIFFCTFLTQDFLLKITVTASWVHTRVYMRHSLFNILRYF